MAGGGEANVANRVFTFEEADRSPEESLTVSIPEVLAAGSHSLHNCLIWSQFHHLRAGAASG